MFGLTEGIEGELGSPGELLGAGSATLAVGTEGIFGVGELVRDGDVDMRALEGGDGKRELGDDCVTAGASSAEVVLMEGVEENLGRGAAASRRVCVLTGIQGGEVGLRGGG